MRTLTLLAAGGFLAGFAWAATADDAQKPGAQAGKKTGIEGGYTFRAGQEDGKPTPGERIQGSFVRINPTDIIVVSKDKKEIFVAKYTLDTTSTPWKITMRGTVPADMTVQGLAQKDGPELKIIYALPGAEAPTGFATKKGQHLFVLEKQKGEGEGIAAPPGNNTQKK